VRGIVQKSYEDKIVLLLVAVLGVALLLAIIQPVHPWGAHTITVSASGYASAIPADVQVLLYANGTGSTSTDAASNLSATLTTLNSTLLNYVGGNESNISTDSYTLTRAFTKMNLTNSTYLATENLHVTVSTKTTSALLDALALIPNVYVSGEYSALSASQTKNLRSDALSSALVNATAQARAIVGQNVSLTPINITVSTYRVYPIASAASVGEGVNIAYYPGTAEVTGDVSVIFSYGR